MAKPTRISQLENIPGNNLQGSDQFVVARGSGESGQTYKVLASSLLKVASTPTINLNFDSSSLTLSANATTAVTSFNTLNSPTVNLNWNSSTRTLSADASYLLTLINQLSTNMQNIGNYPYLEYAWVTAPNAAGQTINSETLTTLTLNTEVADTGNFGSISSNQITLAAGTYRYSVTVPMTLANSQNALVGINDASGVFLARRHYATNTPHYWYVNTESPNGPLVGDLEGQFTINVQTSIKLVYLGIAGNIVGITGTGPFASSTPNLDQRTTIKLWKVG